MTLAVAGRQRLRRANNMSPSPSRRHESARGRAYDREGNANHPVATRLGTRKAPPGIVRRRTRVPGKTATTSLHTQAGRTPLGRKGYAAGHTNLLDVEDEAPELDPPVLGDSRAVRKAPLPRLAAEALPRLAAQEGDSTGVSEVEHGGE